jgi:hypothetical protein
MAPCHTLNDDKLLHEKTRETVDGYDLFVKESDQDLMTTQAELAKLTQQLLKEQAVTKSLT